VSLGEGGGSSSLLAEELLDVLRTICSDTKAPALTAHLAGTTSPRQPSPRIAPTRYTTIRAIELKPWTADDYGLADLTLASSERWKVDDLEPLLRPLRSVPTFDQSRPTLQGIWDGGLAAWAAVYLDLAADGTHRTIEGIRIRIEPQVG
jgi:hypothetical protein